MKHIGGFCLLVLFLLPLFGQHSYSFPQPTKKKKANDRAATLNPRQIDIMERIDFDLRAFCDLSEFGGQVRFNAYGGMNKPVSEIMQRMKAGLRDRRNLPDVLKQLKIGYERQGSMLKALTIASVRHDVFPSLSGEECDHLLNMADGDVLDLANRYTNYLIWLDAEIQKLPKY